MSELGQRVSGSVFCDILVRKVREYFKVEEHRKDFEEWYRKEYFKDEENRKKFEIWYQEKYGKPYKWRKTQ